jgi:hypothetical protein
MFRSCRAGLSALLTLVCVGCYETHQRRTDAASGSDAGSDAESPAGSVIAACRPRDGIDGECPPDLPFRHYTILRGEVTVDGRSQPVCVCAPAGCQPFVEAACRAFRPEIDPPDLECAYTVPRHEGGGYCLHPCERDTDCPALTRCFDVSEVLDQPYDMPRACFAVLGER